MSILSMFPFGGMGGGTTEGMYCWAKQEAVELEDYTELSYIESTGTQCIDTGVAASSKIKIQAKFNMTAITTYVIIGYYKTSADSFRLFNTDGACYLDYYDSVVGDYRVLKAKAFPINTDHEIEFGNFYVKNLVTGKIITSDAVIADFTKTTNIYIAGNSNYSSGKFYYCKIYDGDTLVRDFIPAKNTSGEAGFYDKVNGVFYGSNGTGEFVAGEEIGVVTEFESIGYILSSDLNAYPQDGYHTDGFYYKLLENDIPWDERGRYAWSQAAGPADVFYEFATKNNMTVSGNTLTSSSSASGWNSAYVVTAGIDVSDPELEVRIEHTIPATGRSYFIAVSDTNATASSQFDHTMFVNGTSLLKGTSGSGQIGTCTVGDVVGLSIKNGTVSYLKNGSALTTGTLSASTVYFTVMVNGASINWGNFIVSTPGAEPFGYVIGNEEDAYPNDGFADDGYYYVKVGATKVSPKYASGTVTTGTVNGTVGYISVSGLGFRPYAIQGFYSTQGIFYAVCDSNGNLSTAKYRASSNNITDATSTFSVTDDGFSGRVGNTTEVVYTWYAIGY